MKICILFFIVLFLSDGGYVHAATEWGTLNKNVESLYQQGDYDGAIAVAKKALQTAERDLGPDHFNVAASLNNLAEVYRVQGQYAVAKPLLKRALVINEKALGPGHIDVAMNLNNLALLLHVQGQHTEAHYTNVHWKLRKKFLVQSMLM